MSYNPNSQLISELNTANGFDLQDTDSMGTLSWDEPTRTASIAVKAGQPNYWYLVNGKKHIETTTKSVTIPDTTGLFFTYFDSTGTLQYTIDSAFFAEMIYENALVHLCRWNATQNEGDCGGEQHGYRMSSSTHQYNHQTFGARYEPDGGLGIEGLANGSQTYTRTLSGYFWDEDIRHTVANQSTHPFLYRLGATGEWTRTALDNKVGYNSGSGDYEWNEWDGSTWKLSKATSTTDYFMTFYVANPSISGKQIFKIIGHSAYKSRALARDAIQTEVSNLKLGGLPGPEILFLYAVIVRKNGNLQDLEDGGLIYDLRTAKGGGSAVPPAPTLIKSRLGVGFDGGGSVITTGTQGTLVIPFDCVISSVTMLADVTGSIVVDIWKDTYANYPPTVADTITSSSKPTISSDIKSIDTTLTGWTVAVTAGDILRFNVDSCSSIKECSITLEVTQ